MLTNDCPRVDIIAACRNSANFLSEMIESVLRQDYPWTNLYIQDGASSDETIDILKRYPIQWSTETDNGISQALNRAIASTNGDVIGFTSADDGLQPGAISAVVEIFKKIPEAIMVYGDCLLKDRTGRIFKLWKGRPFDLDSLFWENNIPFQTVYVKRQAIYSVGGFDESMKIVQDWDLWLRLGARFPNEYFKYIPRIQGYYRFSYDYNSAGTNFSEAVKCYEKAVFKFFNDPDSIARLRKGKKRALAGTFIAYTNYYIRTDQRLYAWKEYIKAFQSYPKLLFTKNNYFTLAKLVLGVNFWIAYQKIRRILGFEIYK